MTAMHRFIEAMDLPVGTMDRPMKFMGAPMAPIERSMRYGQPSMNIGG